MINCASGSPSCKIGWKQHTGQNGNSKYLKLKLKLHFHGWGDGKSAIDAEIEQYLINSGLTCILLDFQSIIEES